MKNNEPELLMDEELAYITGGEYSESNFYQILEWVSGSSGLNTSDDTPRFQVGDVARMNVMTSHRTEAMSIIVEIVSVDGKKGVVCREYVYTVKVVDLETQGFRHYYGHVVKEVHESRLYGYRESCGW